jgi:hypothetical protein
MSNAPRIVVALGVILLGVWSGFGEAQSNAPLTDQDRAGIRELSAGYARALGLCEAQAYAGLFAAPDGYFASGPRGKVVGHDKLVALVESEPFCNDNSERRARNTPADIVIEPSAEGATGKVAVGAGHYEDFYAKTPQGWRFKGRTYISPQEEAAHLTAADFEGIRKLAGNDTGDFADVYSTTSQGKRFRSAGVVIAPSPDGATGRAVLKSDGGRYEDVYARGAQGWRFKSRTYVGPGEGATASAAPAATTAGTARVETR